MPSANVSVQIHVNNNKKNKATLDKLLKTMRLHRTLCKRENIATRTCRSDGL